MLKGIDETQELLECQRRSAWLLDNPPASIGQMVRRTRDRLSHARRREIRIQASDPGNKRLPTGMWMAYPDYDVVWVDARTSRLHQGAIILHEFGHMINGHQPVLLNPDEEHDQHVQRFIDDRPDLDSTNIHGVMARCGDGLTDDLTEWQAETTGRILLAAVARGPAGGGLGRFLSRG